MPDSSPNLDNGSFTESLKVIPVVFVWVNIIALWVIYMFFHCIPLLSHSDRVDEGICKIVVFNILTLLICICYFKAILTNPGRIPSKQDGDSTWEYVHAPNTTQDSTAVLGLGLMETKRSGDRRHCKWCAKYKPDRCHHCRVCRQCILKMDHHCPWIYNCVGFANHKYFFLLVFYSSIACNMIVWTMLDSVMQSTEAHIPFVKLFFQILGETLAGFLGIVITAFFFFHVWLMLRGMTTIEFCEKSMKKTGFDSSAYDYGLWGNLTAALGDNPLTWLLPIAPPSGNGINFVGEETPLAKGMEVSRGTRLKDMKQKRNSRKKHRGAGTGEYAASDASCQEVMPSVQSMPLSDVSLPLSSEQELFHA